MVPPASDLPGEGGKQYLGQRSELQRFLDADRAQLGAVGAREAAYERPVLTNDPPRPSGVGAWRRESRRRQRRMKRPRSASPHRYQENTSSRLRRATASRIWI